MPTPTITLLDVEAAIRGLSTRIDLKKFFHACGLSGTEAMSKVREILSDKAPDETLDGDGPRTRIVRGFRLAHEQAGWKEAHVYSTLYLTATELRHEAVKRMKDQGEDDGWSNDRRRWAVGGEIIQEKTTALLAEINRCNSDDELAALLCRRGWKDEDAETFIERFGHSKAAPGKFQEWWEAKGKPSYQTKA